MQNGQIIESRDQDGKRYDTLGFSGKSLSAPVPGGPGKTSLPLRSVILVSATLSDLLKLLRKTKEPSAKIGKIIAQLEGIIEKKEAKTKLKDAKDSLSTIIRALQKISEPGPQITKALKLLSPENLSAGFLQSSILQVSRILKAIEDPSEELKELIKRASELAKECEERGDYGKVVDLDSLTKLFKCLDDLEDPPTHVTKALTVLRKLLGKEEEGAPETEEKGKLPSYGIAKLEASRKPGVYRARLIRAGKALDGTIWPEGILEGAVQRKLFEGIPLNAISYSGSYGPEIEYHLPSDSDLAGKIVGNQVGFVQDVSWEAEDKAVYGYVYVTDSARRDLIDAMLEEGLDAPGMSIYANGAKGPDETVTEMSSIYSMDLVTFPAADGAILSQALTAAVKNWGMQRKKTKIGGTKMIDQRGKAYVTGGSAERDGDLERRARAAVAWDQYIMINDWVGGERMEKNKHWLIPMLEGIALSKLQSDPNISDEDLYVHVNEIFTRYIWPAGKEPIHTPGKPLMTGLNPALESRMKTLEGVAYGLNQRVKQVDIDELVDQKLQASKLPPTVQQSLRTQLHGKPLAAEEIGSFIKFQQEVCDGIAVNLKSTAGVTLEGALTSEDGTEDSLERALKKLFSKYA